MPHPRSPFGRWVVISVDDRIPCKKGTRTPLFLKAHGNELWAVLLEKASLLLTTSY